MTVYHLEAQREQIVNENGIVLVNLWRSHADPNIWHVQPCIDVPAHPSCAVTKHRGHIPAVDFACELAQIVDRLLEAKAAFDIANEELFAVMSRPEVRLPV